MRVQLSLSLHLPSASTPRSYQHIASTSPLLDCSSNSSYHVACRTVPTTDKHISMWFRPNSSCLNQNRSKSKAGVTNKSTCIQLQTAFLSKSFPHTLLHTDSLSQGNFQQNFTVDWLAAVQLGPQIKFRALQDKLSTPVGERPTSVAEVAGLGLPTSSFTVKSLVWESCPKLCRPTLIHL